MICINIAKKAVAKRALSYVKDGMIVGLGSGSTATCFIQGLGQKLNSGCLKNIKAVPTSKTSEKIAFEYGLDVFDIDEVDFIDLAVDGANEVDQHFNGLKGVCQLRERIVANNSNKVIWIVDETKLVPRLGQSSVLVEIVRFGSEKLLKHFADKGYKPMLRTWINKEPFLTDGNNYIVELNIGEIFEPKKLSQELYNTAGVVEHGIFLNHPDIVISSDSKGNISIRGKNKKENQ